MLIVPQGAVAPTTITLRFMSPVFGPDLTGVTAVTAGLLRRDGTTASLTFTVVTTTTRECVAQYTFAGTELTVTGAYFLAPALTVQGGTVQSETVPMFVGGPYNSIPRLEQDAWIMATVPIASLGPVRSSYRDVTGNITASPYQPIHALDLRTSAIAIVLWAGLDGDYVEFADAYGAAASHAFTLNAATGQTVAQGNGTYASSRVTSTANFVLRFRYRASSLSWVQA